MPENTEVGHRSSDHPRTALCLSGGGYRAMLFHVGSLWRLNELAYLPKLDRISSVSGGSITAGVLGHNWGGLAFEDTGIATEFRQRVVQPIRGLARKTIDVSAILARLTLVARIRDPIKAAYGKHLFGNATLQDLPDRPQFVINATNLQSGVLWRFSKRYMRDYRVGRVEEPTTELAVAVAASSAFPPFLSPVRMRIDPSAFSSDLDGEDLHHGQFLTKVVLSDGGVYDNLGLEAAKRFSKVLVSDGGGKISGKESVPGTWGRQMYRVLGVVDNQVRSLRKRHLIDSFVREAHDGTYWGIRSNIDHYDIDDPLDCPVEATTLLADMPTRLRKMSEQEQERLINWGYAITDTAMRRHVDPSLPAPAGMPYPDSGVE